MNLRHFTSRWSKYAKGGGLGSTVLALAVFLFSTFALAVTLYQNSDGNVTDWIEVYDPNANHNLTDAGNYQKYAASSNAVSYARYQYGTQTWTNYYFQVKYVSQYFLGGTQYIQVGVRCSGVQTGNPQMGYWFQHNIGTGLWQTAAGGLPPSWTVVLSNSCTISDGSVIKVQVIGSGVATTVSIYVGTTKYYEVTSPGETYDTGSCGIGMATNYASAYIYMDDLLVESIDVSTPTDTPTPTATTTQTPVISSTITPTPTASPTSTLTPGINTVTLKDPFFPNSSSAIDLDGSTPTVRYSGGNWSDPGHKYWIAKYLDIPGYQIGQMGGGVGAKGYTDAKFDLNAITFPAYYVLETVILNMFETGTIRRGWQWRKGDDGTLVIIADTSSAVGTTLTAKALDAAGNTTVLASVALPGVPGSPYTRPKPVGMTLGLEDFGNTVNVYYSTTDGSGTVYVTPTAKVMTFYTSLFNSNDMIGPWYEEGSAYYSHYALVIENYATSTPTITPTSTSTPTFTPTPTLNITPETGTSRRHFFYDNNKREMKYDNKSRNMPYDNRRRHFTK